LQGAATGAAQGTDRSRGNTQGVRCGPQGIYKGPDGAALSLDCHDRPRRPQPGDDKDHTR